MFRWAKNEEHIEPSVYDAIRDFENLKKGRTTAPEGKKN